MKETGTVPTTLYGPMKLDQQMNTKKDEETELRYVHKYGNNVQMGCSNNLYLCCAMACHTLFFFVLPSITTYTWNLLMINQRI
jgi:hypothetical protein